MNNSDSQKSVIINKATLENIDVLNVYNSIITDVDHWHKFIIKNVAHIDRDSVMNGFLESVYPSEFLPIKFKRDRFGTVEFLGKFCEETVSILIKKKLNISISHEKVIKQFPVDIILRYCPIGNINVDLQDTFCEILKKRYDPITFTLDLEEFAKDPDLVEYCPLSQPKLLNFVLYLSIQFEPKIIKLGKNHIRNLSEVLCWENLTKVVELDLQQNLISSIEDLEAIRVLNLKSLNLDNNPICQNFESSKDYLAVMKSFFPYLVELDTRELSLVQFIPKSNFLCSDHGYKFVENFVRTFFQAYDTEKRYLLAGLYHPNALFSATADFEGSSDKTGVAHFINLSRNLNTTLVTQKDNLVTRHADIIKLFMGLPLTQHDYYSFKIDLLIYTESSASIVVTGNFCEPSNSGESKYYSFSRHFILNGQNFEDFVITNELLHVAPSRIETAYKSTHPVYDKSVIKPKDDDETASLIEIMSQISGLNLFWSKGFLLNANFDLRDALEAFVKYFEDHKIHMTAFNVAPNPNINEYPTPLPTTIPERDVSSSMSVQTDTPVLPTPEESDAKKSVIDLTNDEEEQQSNVKPADHKQMFERPKNSICFSIKQNAKKRPGVKAVKESTTASTPNPISATYTKTQTEIPTIKIDPGKNTLLANGPIDSAAHQSCAVSSTTPTNNSPNKKNHKNKKNLGNSKPVKKNTPSPNINILIQDNLFGISDQTETSGTKVTLNDEDKKSPSTENKTPVVEAKKTTPVKVPPGDKKEEKIVGENKVTDQKSTTGKTNTEKKKIAPERKQKQPYKGVSRYGSYYRQRRRF